MKLRAVIFDVYKTLLDVGRPPADREERWLELTRTRLGREATFGLAEFSAACDAVISREHAKARATGIPHPEIFWPDVVAEVLPAVASLPVIERREFLFAQQSLFHSVVLMPGAAPVLRLLQEKKVRLGIASNAQPYTLQELEQNLTLEGLAFGMFERELCFWSFEHGFSKPDPHVYRLLCARLQLHGVQPAETLMVGDRRDNDIEPAKAQGWQTWRLTTVPGSGAGAWSKLGEFIAAHT